ncbi:hypothetical protein VTN96DRAFT_1541 [Rasamsonia emersonii]|uniref:Sin3 complex subunit (Stb2) n=1 Tax=Rasamsonia emersonii (strain ATCC 16479 / CBS 393.64 / IMI 116815) TaxID=1408163 RepID=A0A0F4Z3T8_RASE3|nr:Sin3 complex subunit (Stb2) [Rasamsonia emersonii CBS 393.64]KKA25015.1 Sin3 complex subunit (Stb2) [Rasamsonia emersonii CBS 393.64]
MAAAAEQTNPQAASSTPGPGQGNNIIRQSLDGEGHVSRARGFAEESAHKQHQKLVLPDPVAFRYLEEDPSTTVLHRRTILQGYEIYIVEQWACSRVHPTFIITTYTGDPSHRVVVGVLSVPTDRNAWSPRLKLYFHAVEQYHAGWRDTDLGSLMVTNLSSFPSALTVVPVPDGDVKKHTEEFIVNENLKRLGCSGRAGLKLQPPSLVVEAKFHQLYRTSERVPLNTAVVELVKQCQIALTIFDKLAPEYVDGLLCDVTERAISDWWADIGTDLYNIEPSDGTLGPTTVSALLGTFMGARNRLHAFGAPVPKDVFDVSALKRGIGSFQKSQKMERTRRLDRQTLDRLHRVTAKAASSEGWTEAVKSTVAELSGKGGEMVMGMVGGRDKGSIADIETLDLERYAQLVTGERSKWLWQGKPPKTGFTHGHENVPRAEDLVFTKDDQGGYVWTSRKRRPDFDPTANRVVQDLERSGKPTDSEPPEDRDQFGKIVSRSLTGKVSDARAGFGRFKDAVGLPGLRSHHHHKHNKDGVDLESDLAYHTGIDSEAETPVSKSLKEPTAEHEESSKKDTQNGPAEDLSKPSSTSQSQKSVPPPPEIHVQPEDSLEETPISPSYAVSQDPKLQFSPQEEGENSLSLSKSRSTEAPSDQVQLQGLAFKSLRRSQSTPQLVPEERVKSCDARWPRHLSFSTVEEVVLVWEGFRTPQIKKGATTNLESAILQEDALFSDAQIFGSRVLELKDKTAPWVEQQVDSVEYLHRKANSLQEELSFVYPERFEEYQSLRERMSQLLGEEGSQLTEGLKKVELLGAKLDYELNVLESKVEDVEQGLQEFERHVDEIETRVKDLVQGERKKDTSWFSWVGRKFGRM